jgi:hypothetical protein
MSENDGKNVTGITRATSMPTSMTSVPTAGSPASQAPDDAIVALKAIAEIGSLFLALAFIAGWSYTASYYTTFGLNPFELDFSVPATSTFAVHMLGKSVWPLVLAVVILGSVVFVYSKAGSLRRLWTGASIAVLLFAVAIAGSCRGRALAIEDMFDTSPRLPNVGFVSKSKAAEPDCLGQGTMDCKLLLHAKGVYYFFVPIVGLNPAAVHDRSLNLYMVADSEISSVRIQRGME